jgi:AcrR family transcriptional regulator
MNDEKPVAKGKVAVQHALITAASDCFARKGIAQVSVREIAQAAGVNHGLVHRHFGSKDQLLKATLAHLSLSVEERLGSLKGTESTAELLPKIFGGTKDVGLHWRVITHALLEGMTVEELQQDFPIFKRIVSACIRDGLNETQALGKASLIFATGLGYMVFEPYLKGAVEHNAANWDDVRAQLMQQFMRIAL